MEKIKEEVLAYVTRLVDMNVSLGLAETEEDIDQLVQNSDFGEIFQDGLRTLLKKYGKALISNK